MAGRGAVAGEDGRRGLGGWMDAHPSRASTGPAVGRWSSCRGAGWGGVGDENKHGGEAPAVPVVRAGEGDYLRCVARQSTPVEADHSVVDSGQEEAPLGILAVAGALKEVRRSLNVLGCPVPLKKARIRTEEGCALKVLGSRTSSFINPSATHAAESPFSHRVPTSATLRRFESADPSFLELVSSSRAFILSGREGTSCFSPAHD